MRRHLRHLFWPAIGSALLGLAVPAVAQEPAFDGSPAQALFDAGTFDEAAEAYRKLAAQYAARYPQSEKLRYYCGRGAEALLYLAIATTDDTSASVVGTDWCDALFMQAFSHVEAGRLPLAVDPLQRAVELAPYNARYLSELGFVLSRIGRLDEGLEAYELAVGASELNRQDSHHKAAALRGIGWIHAERREWDLAEDALRRSLEIEPHSELALGELEYIAQKREAD